jgi:ribosomal protein S12 methylthiotransferase accessory factor
MVEFDEFSDLSTRDAVQDVMILCEKIREVGLQALLVDVTTEDMRDLGFTVVKAVVPGFHPLFMGHAIRSQGGDRLWEVPRKLGYPGVNREEGDNPVPHPYP